jgi:predicted Zn-dependent protease
VRAHQSKAALASLKKAVDLQPADPRFSFVLAVALAGNGERDQAIRVLEASLKARPNDVSTLRTLAGYLQEAGDSSRASELARELESMQRE